MIIELAQSKDKPKIAKLDCHIPPSHLGECIYNDQVYVLKDDSIKNGGQNHRLKDPVVGVLRYSLFWQTIPFLDLLYLDAAYRHQGFGTQMMNRWEETMKKHILCLGDSNTHGYCADPADCADHGIRFNEDERWTCRLQTALGSDYLVTEEGLSGRTTVFVDPIHESMDALSVAYSLLKSHEVIDLLIIMLGTNDVKERFNANAACIGAGMERLILKAKSVDCWGTKAPNILVVAPPRIGDGFHDAVMGEGCVEKSKGVAEQFRIVAERQNVHFLNAADCEFNQVDFMHLTRKGHAQLADLLAKKVPTLL